MADGKSHLNILIRLFRGYRKHFVFLFIFGVLGAFLEGVGINTIIPILSFLLGNATPLVGNVISTATKNFFEFLNIPFSFRFLLIFMGSMFIMRAIMLSIFSYIRARINASFLCREMNDLLMATLNARWIFLMKQRSGYLQNTLFWDIRQCTNLLDVLAQFIQSLTGFLAYFFVASSISPKITFVTLGMGLFLLLLLRPLVRKTALYSEWKGLLEKDYSSYLAEHIAGLKVVKASGMGEKIGQVGRKLLDNFRSAYIKGVVVHSLGSTVVQPFSFVFLIAVFSFAYRLPSFDMAAFVAVLYLIQKIFVYLQSAQGSFHSIADHVSFAKNVLKFRDQLVKESDLDINYGRSFSLQNQITFKKVFFEYQPSRPVLLGPTFTISKGDLTAIIGPSGGGKTTVVDLLLRLFQPVRGQILIDNTPVEDININEWRKNIGYVSQDFFLFNLSVKDNIRFYDQEISDEDIHGAAKKAHIYDEVMKLPQGFETVVGERGVSLSVGQRQRIAIARALVKKPTVLILDEATSALDSESDRFIRETVEIIKGQVTLVVIAHRLSTIMGADKLLVLENGIIVEEGKPSEMIQKPTSYLSRMINMQAPL